MPRPNAAVGILFVAAEGAGAGGGGGAALCLITTFLAATIFDSMIFFSQNKPPLLFSEGVILDLSGYYGVFLARGFAGALTAGALAAAGFLAKVRFFFTGSGTTTFVTESGLSVLVAHCSGESLCRPTQYPVGLRPHPHLGGSLARTYGIGVVSAGGSNLYGA